jgi:hypothetical protein
MPHARFGIPHVRYAAGGSILHHFSYLKVTVARSLQLWSAPAERPHSMGPWASYSQ